MSRRPLTWFMVFVGATFAVALGAYAWLTASSARELGLVALVLFASALLTLIVGQLAYRLSWLKRSPRIFWTLLAGYALVGVVTLLGVLAAALLMFINTDDVRLVAVLMLFGLGIAVSFGYLISTDLSRDARRLVAATDQVAQGQFDTRIDLRGRDELAELALAFNEMTESLGEAAQRRDAMERMRSDLVAWAGHDLRTPLTSVTVIVEALADGMVTDPATAQRYLETAKRDLRVLGLLIDDLSLLAQIDAGGLHLSTCADSLAPMLLEVVDSFSLQAQQKNVRFAKDVDEGLGACSFDDLYLRRALANLVENAVRHAPEGGHVRVRAYAGDSGAGDARENATPHDSTALHDSAARAAGGAVIEVWNDGPPISAEDLPHVFERFYRSDRSRGRATGKAGLGLAIAKAIIEAHGGTITVESGPERGTNFIVRLLAS